MTLASALFRVSLAGLFMMAALTPVHSALTDTAAAPSGIITGLTGSPGVVGKQAGGLRPLSLGGTITPLHELKTQQDETLEILWGERTLIQVQPHSSMTINEQRDGQVQVHLQAGGVRVALAYGGPSTDIVTVQTPTGRVFTRGGIVEVSMAQVPSSFLSRISTAFSGTEASPSSTRVETVSVLEGQAGIEPLTAPGKSEMLDAGVKAVVAAGTVQHLSNLPSGVDRGLGLPSADQRQSTPVQLTKRIARVHVDHALEVERLVTTTPSLDGKEPAAGPDLKGAVVATSLGVPTTSIGATQSTGGSSLAPLPTVPGPTLSPVQNPTVTTLGTNQSGGLNSKSILNDVLSDNNGKGGKSKGKRD